MKSAGLGLLTQEINRTQLISSQSLKHVGRYVGTSINNAEDYLLEAKEFVYSNQLALSVSYLIECGVYVIQALDLLQSSGVNLKRVLELHQKSGGFISELEEEEENVC